MLIERKSRPGSMLGHVELKPRSLCQILEKPYVDSKGHSFYPVLMKLLSECLSPMKSFAKS